MEQKVLKIETQIITGVLEVSLLMQLLKVAKEAGYTHVRDNYAQGSYDEYDIDEAIQKFNHSTMITGEEEAYNRWRTERDVHDDMCDDLPY